MRHWGLVRTKPLSEYVAATSLERNGYELYFPRVQTHRPRSGYSDAPLFPGYLFVRQAQEGSDLPPFYRIAGLIGWVRFDGVVPGVADEVIAELDQRLQEINRNGGYLTRLRMGDTARVASGPLQALAQVLEEPRSPQSQVRVLLRFMGRLVPARVAWQDLRPIGDEDISDNEGRPARRTRGKGRWVRGFGPRAVAGV